MAEAELLDWALSNHVTDAATKQPSCIGYSLSIATFPHAGGRGLAAARDLKEGELILLVPENALLSVESAKEDAHFMKALQLFPDLSPVQALIALLLREIGKGVLSRWFPYLKTLPRSYQTLAQFSRFEIQALQVEDAVWAAERAVEMAHKEWEETKPLLQTLGLRHHLLTLKAWLWACSTVSSRTLHVPWNSAGTLCPVGDLFNYAPPGAPFEETVIETFSQCNLSEVHVQNGALPREHRVSAEMQGCEGSKFNEVNYDVGRVLRITDRLTDGGYDATAKAYCFYAREDYKKGDQVLLCYGLYTNLELLEHYGFMLPQNPNDKVSIRLHTLKSFTSDMVPMQLPNFNPHGSMHIEVDGRPSFQLLAALRLCCAPAEVRKQKGHLALIGQQLCVANDVVLYQKLKEECMNLLVSFPTTMYVDNVLMHVVSLCSSIDGLAGLLDLLGHRRVLCQAGHKLLADSICGWSVLCASNQQQVLGEVQSFLESQEGCARIASSKREGDLQMQRWWLSIKWRFCYKRILHRCISFCGRQLQLLSRSKKTKGDTS